MPGVCTGRFLRRPELKVRLVRKCSWQSARVLLAYLVRLSLTCRAPLPRRLSPFCGRFDLVSLRLISPLICILISNLVCFLGFLFPLFTGPFLRPPTLSPVLSFSWGVRGLDGHHASLKRFVPEAPLIASNDKLSRFLVVFSARVVSPLWLHPPFYYSIILIVIISVLFGPWLVPDARSCASPRSLEPTVNLSSCSSGLGFILVHLYLACVAGILRRYLMCRISPAV